MPLGLEVASGPRTGERFEVTESLPFLVGRGPKANAQIPDQHMSSAHFVIVSEAGVWKIEDRGSSNGTFVNESRVESADLQDGDRIRAGTTSFAVYLEQPEHAVFGRWRVPTPPAESGWEVVEGSGFKRVGEGARSSILFAEDKVSIAWPTQDYIEQQRQIILKQIAHSDVSSLMNETLPKAGGALALAITFQLSAGEPVASQKQFYIRDGEQMSILTVTVLASEPAAVRDEVSRIVAAVEYRRASESQMPSSE